jgi:hypothetical protein
MIDLSSPEYDKVYNWCIAEQARRGDIAVSNALTYDVVAALLAIACLIGGAFQGDSMQVGVAIFSLALSLLSFRLCERAIHKTDADVVAHYIEGKPYPELPYKFLQALNYASGVSAIIASLFFL